MIDLSAIDFGTGQKPRPAEDGRAHIEKIKPRQLVGHIEVCLKKSADSSDILPVTLEDVRKDAVRRDCVRYNVPAEVWQSVVQELENHVAVKDINAHRSQEKLAGPFDSQLFIPTRVEAQ